ncbi:hypothetical protein HYU93_00085 [Candidatus Daviesbacteria bacterium]|nr:hypothetical protein [Candidatus Daviesbacteria bacterium]
MKYMLQTIFTKKFIILSLVLAFIYLILSVYLMNFTLVKLTITGSYPMGYKFNLLVNLLGGMLTAMTGTGLLILILTAILAGINLVLLSKRILILKFSGKLHWVAGGSSLLGIAGSGCAACGLPVIALLGLSGSIAYLPFGGSEISVISLALLSISLYFLLKSYNKELSCKVQFK